MIPCHSAPLFWGDNYGLASGSVVMGPRMASFARGERIRALTTPEASGRMVVHADLVVE